MRDLYQGGGRTRDLRRRDRDPAGPLGRRLDDRQLDLELPHAAADAEVLGLGPRRSSATASTT